MSAVGSADNEGACGVSFAAQLGLVAQGLSTAIRTSDAGGRVAELVQSAKAMTPTLTKGATMINRKAVSAATLAVVASLAAAAPAAASYPPALRSAFVHVCVGKGSPLKGCECLFNYVQSRESLKVFLNQGRIYQNGGPIARIEITGGARCGLK
jgi:hypothetical protein